MIHTIATEPDNTITKMSKITHEHCAAMRKLAEADCGIFELKHGARLCNRIFCCGRSAAGGIKDGDHIFYMGSNGTEPGIAERTKKSLAGWRVRINGRWVMMRNCQRQDEWAKENNQ